MKITKYTSIEIHKMEQEFKKKTGKFLNFLIVRGIRVHTQNA